MSETPSDPEVDRPADADERAIQILRSVMAIASEIALDLDVTWSQARELFAGTLFARAETRYGTAPRIAAALDTSLRTVKQYRHRRREDQAQPTVPTFNMRRRVLHLLDNRPHTLEEIERALPVGSDVNYARSAVQSLLEDGLVVKDPDSGAIRQPDDSFVPWYLRPELHPGSEIQRLCDSFARLLGTRLTPKAEIASIPALLMTMVHNLPEDLVKEYQEQFVKQLADFDRVWTGRVEGLEERRKPVLAGASIAIGEIGEPMHEDHLAQLERGDARHLALGDEAPETYRRYYGAAGDTRDGAEAEANRDPGGDPANPPDPPDDVA